jgi:cytidylate kinase
MASAHDALRYRGNVCIAGLTASGKTTHSHLLCGEFGTTYISGSQIQLNLMGISPVQSREFWVTQEAKALWDKEQFSRIDSELLNLECLRNGCVFDTSTMPWRHRRPALCIWLESSLESRVLKSIVSHHGNGAIALDEYPRLIAEKDRATRSLYKELYGLRIGDDLAPFDLVLDISTLIKTPTLAAALSSIRTTHRVIRSAVAFYLTGEARFRTAYLRAASRNAGIVRHDRVLDARRDLEQG